MSKIAKLFKVELNGMKYGSPCYGISYVVATSLDSAYGIVNTFLSQNKIGFPKDRILSNITLVASNEIYGDVPILYLEEGINNALSENKNIMD